VHLDDDVVRPSLGIRPLGYFDAARHTHERLHDGPVYLGDWPMPAFICRTCGVQYAPTDAPPASCPICADERQYVGWNGQQWTTLSDLSSEGRKNTFKDIEPGITQIATQPSIAIGQRALVVQTPGGNVMWDCISFIDSESIQRVRDLGGLQGIAISHPHFYACMVEWSEAFGGCPIYIHQADGQWVQYRTSALQLWSGETQEILPGVTLINTGGHFEGSTALHWSAGADGRGLLLTGDSLTVVMDRRYLSFMYSYPNLIPLSERAVRRIADSVRPFKFERILGGWDGRDVIAAGNDAVDRSVERYVRYLKT
jgi:glyoxylase-like metal-dependent hydrolase (beta-lactamase superfamily II)